MNKPVKMIKNSAQEYFYNKSIVYDETEWKFEAGSRIVDYFHQIHELTRFDDTTGYCKMIYQIEDCSSFWLRDIVIYWMDEFARRYLSAAWCHVFENTIENTIGNEKIKFREADAFRDTLKNEFFM